MIPPHGGFRKLKSFQIARFIYDVTSRFCDRYIPRYSRTRDQMVQAARSGVQNIAEGSQASGTSKKTELKLTSVARSSLEELQLDFEANAALSLLNLCCYLLDRQLKHLSDSFENEGGFTERLYRFRARRRKWK